jgi:hypothetical protein
MSLTITTPTGSRTINQARVTQDDESRSLRREIEGGKLIVYGDGLQAARPLVVQVELQENTNAATGALAQGVIDDAKIATSITTPRGTRGCDGILSHSLSSDGPRVTLTLEFAPTRGDYS